MYKVYDVSKWSSSDRFIPTRSAGDYEYSHYLINNSEADECWEDKNSKPSDLGVVLTAKRQYYKQQYISQIKSTLLPRERRVLEFSNRKRDFLYRCDQNKDSWPVFPRSKPLLAEPSEILDMPNLETFHCRQVVDWGKQGFLAAIHEGEVYMWHPSKRFSKRLQTVNANVKYCIKWNFDGTLLAMTSNNSTISILDFPTLKIKAKIKCYCYTCAVTSIAWTPTNKLISGCSYGWVCTWTSNLECTSYIKLHAGEIINVKLSISSNYVVTTGVDGVLNLLTPSSKKILMKRKCLLPIKAVDWHPWRNSLLALVEDFSLNIYSVNSLQRIDKKKYPRDTLFDCMTFNPKSGELAVGYCRRSEIVDEPTSRLSVLKNLNSVVDEILYRNGRQTCLLWDDTGTKLATVSSDENLCIWDFFGTSTRLKKRFANAPLRFPSISEMLKESDEHSFLKCNRDLVMFDTLKLLGGQIR